MCLTYNITVNHANVRAQFCSQKAFIQMYETHQQMPHKMPKEDVHTNLCIHAVHYLQPDNTSNTHFVYEKFKPND